MTAAPIGTARRPRPLHGPPRVRNTAREVAVNDELPAGDRRVRELITPTEPRWPAATAGPPGCRNRRSGPASCGQAHGIRGEPPRDVDIAVVRGPTRRDVGQDRVHPRGRPAGWVQPIHSPCAEWATGSIEVSTASVDHQPHGRHTDQHEHPPGPHHDDGDDGVEKIGRRYPRPYGYPVDDPVGDRPLTR